MRGPVVAGLALCALSAVARADATLTSTVGTDVTEGAYTLDVELRGLLATVELRQTFVNAGDRDTEAIYEFELPSAAVIDGGRVLVPGKREEVAFGVDTRAAITRTPDDAADSGVPDLVLLHAIGHRDGDPATGDPDLTRYELRVFPVPAHQTVTVRTRLVMPLEVADGRVILRLPARGDAANLSRETGVVRVHPTGGILGYDHFHVDETALRGAGVIPFSHGRRGGFVLDATPRVAGAEPLLWFDTVALDGKRGAIAVSLFAPRSSTSDRLPFDRIAILVDTSRSMDGALEGAARIVDAVIANARPDAKIQTLLFDHGTHAVDGWRAPDAAARAATGKAIRGAALANGTSVTAALGAAGAALGEPTQGTRSLVLVVTDGLVPLDTTGLDLAQHVGAPRAGLTVSFVLVTPDQAALPDILHGPLADVANRTGGMVLATRAGEVTARATAIASQLGHAAPLHDLQLVGADAVTGVMLPDVVPAGGGTVAIGWYRHAAPTRLALNAVRGEQALHVNARRAASPEIGDLALATLEPDGLAVHDDGAEPAQPEIDAARAMVTIARRRRGVVTDETSLIALDSRARFATERRNLAIGGGPFTREPPPGETQVPATVPQVRIGHIQLRGDLDARLIHGMIELGLLPRARTCFQPLLLKHRASEGTVRVDLELSRGEVTSARIASTDFSADISVCLLEAVYQLDVPRTVLDDLPDTVYLVHYPLTFRSLAAGEVVLPGDADSSDPIDTGIHVDDADQPLGAVHP
jgi:Vault protein inter-alpha-trypsin domain